MIRKTYEEGLNKVGIFDKDMQESDSEGRKYWKTVIKYEIAKTNMLEAKSDANRETAINLALKYKEDAKDHVRAMSHNEL